MALTPQNVGYLPARVPCNGRLGFKKKTGPRGEKTLITLDTCPASLSHWRFIHQPTEASDCPHFTAEEPHDENHCPITQQQSVLELRPLAAAQGSPTPRCPCLRCRRQVSADLPHSLRRRGYGTSEGESVYFLPTTSSRAF